MTWQNDAKYYQFWADGDAAGRFSIENVRPGKYTLHAIADNVLRDFAQAEVTVAAGKKVDLGSVVCSPLAPAVPLPAAVWTGLAMMGGLTGMARFKRARH